MKYTKFILSVLAVVLVASLGVVLTSCESSSPPPPTTGGEDITISKVKLFENNSPVAPSLLKEVSYERTVNAHKIYIKTTFVASDYIDALRGVDPRIGNAYVDRNNTGDIWGLLLIGIDRVNQNTPKKNIINFGGLKVKTADSNFEFDALIRVNSAWNKANTRDGLPVVAENNNFLLEMWDSSKGMDIENNDWWSGVSEKKYQGGTDPTYDAADKFVSGSYTEVTNEYGDTNRLDANVSYDASTGEYVITIPFTVIPYNDIDKIVVFGAQHAGWRPGANISAVVKPLGSSKVLVYADVNGVAAGLPVVKVPKSKNESPSLIQGSFPDVISSITTNIDAKAGAVTTDISVELVSISSNASNMIVFTGPQGSSTVSKTNWLFYAGTNNQGDYLYTNAIALSFSAVNDGSDFYAPTNYTVSVVAGNGGNATISVTVEPTISAPGSVLLVNPSATVSGITVIDGYNPSTTLIVSNATTGSNITISGGSFTITNVPSVADDMSDILGASAGDTIVVLYNDTTSGKTISANISVVAAPAGWTLAGQGEYDIWAAKIAAVFYKTNATSLEVLVYMNPVGGGNNLYLAIDVTNRTLGIDASTNTHSGDLTTGWGSFWMTNEAGIDFDFVAWGWRDDDGNLNYSGANRIESDGTGTDVQSSVAFSQTNLVDNTTGNYYFNIPYTAMGATSGNVVNIYVFFGKTGGTAGNEGIRSIFPANASVTNSGGWGNYVTRLTNKSPNIVLP
jgi:hypothetical protein